MPKSTGYS